MIRAGTEADVPVVARLHATEIGEGFLSSLGPPFLARLYRRIVRHPASLLVVADDGGAVVGFAAATERTGALYRSFLVRDGLAAAAAAPRLVGSGRRLLETLSYPRHAGPGGDAELLAVAVAAHARGRGLGRAQVEGAVAQLAGRGSGSVRVVTASDNRPALALYAACGFRPAGSLDLHRGATSQVLRWR
ncbi:MAG: N-acetyltransferase family protein [Acidimicrobiia bacterium]